jgi:hypothetical protein
MCPELGACIEAATMAKSTNTSSRVWSVDLPEPTHSFELTSQVESRLTFVNNVEAFYLSGLDPGEPRVQVGRPTPPALHPELLKFLISTLNQPPQRPAKRRSPGASVEWESLGQVKYTQVVAAENPTQNGIKDALFPSKRKAGLTSSHSRATRVFFAG